MRWDSQWTSEFGDYDYRTNVDVLFNRFYNYWKLEIQKWAAQMVNHTYSRIHDQRYQYIIIDDSISTSISILSCMFKLRIHQPICDLILGRVLTDFLFLIKIVAEEIRGYKVMENRLGIYCVSIYLWQNVCLNNFSLLNSSRKLQTRARHLYKHSSSS